MKCPICAAPMSRLFSSRDYRRPSLTTEWPVGWCRNCNFGRVEADLDPEQIAQAYAVDYYTHGGKEPEAAEPNMIERVRSRLAWQVDFGRVFDPSEIPLDNGIAGTMCDLGCGNGDVLGRFKALGYEVIGVEPDEKARKVAGEKGKVYSGTAEALPPEVMGSKFNVVVLSHVLEHCLNAGSALANCNRILNDDGTLVIEVPNNDAIGFARLGPAWPWSDIPRHLNFFTEKSLRKMVAGAGLQVTQIMHTGYSRQFSPVWIKNQDAIAGRIGRKQNAELFSWQLLLESCFASHARKYDSIRVHCRKA